MCETCAGHGVLYKNNGIGIAISKCPSCEPEEDACAALQERIDAAIIEYGIA